MPITKTIKIWDDDSKSPKNAWWSKDVGSLNTALFAVIPKKCLITAASMKVYADFDGAGGLANVYMKYGFGGNGSISTQLGGEHKLTKDESPYPSSGIDVISYMNTDGFTNGYGNYLSVNIYTSNIVVSALRMGHVELTVTYREFYNCSVKASPENGGTVYCEGGAFEGTATIVQAIPNHGYKFVGWYKNGTLVSNKADDYLSVTENNTVFTAVFEKELINNIQIGKTKPSGIYYNESTKTITFVIADAVSITPTGADTLDGYHIVISNTVPSGVIPIKGVQIGTTYAYTT